LQKTELEVKDPDQFLIFAWLCGYKYLPQATNDENTISSFLTALLTHDYRIYICYPLDRVLTHSWRLHTVPNSLIINYLFGIVLCITLLYSRTKGPESQVFK
jgi:hypothetical protein